LVRAVAVDGDACVTGGWDGLLRRWRWHGNAFVPGEALLAHADRVEFVDAATTRDDPRRLLVSGGRDCSLRVYDLGASKAAPLRKTYAYESVSCGCVEWPTASFGNVATAAIGARGGGVSFWDVETGSMRSGFQRAHEGEVSALISTSASDADPDRFHGARFVSGGADGAVRGWDLRVGDGKPAFEVTGHSRRVYSVTAAAGSAAGGTIYVGDFSETVKAYDVRFLISSDAGNAPRSLRRASSFERGGAVSPIAGIAYRAACGSFEGDGNLGRGASGAETRRAVFFSTAAFFDDSSDAARGCARLFSVTHPDRSSDGSGLEASSSTRYEETDALISGGGVLSALGVSRCGTRIVAGDVDGGITAWRRRPENAERGAEADVQRV
jgi:WD40 repeat protein